MTVKELKKFLRGVPDNVEVSILVDGYESESRAPWMAHYTKEEEEDGEVTEEFRINC
jgi:hypothetical protein